MAGVEYFANSFEKAEMTPTFRGVRVVLVVAIRRTGIGAPSATKDALTFVPAARAGSLMAPWLGPKLRLVPIERRSGRTDIGFSVLMNAASSVFTSSDAHPETVVVPMVWSAFATMAVFS